MKSFIRDPLDLRKIDPTSDMAGIDPEHALGFLTCTPDLNYKELLAGVVGEYPVPIVGGTVLGNPFDEGIEPFLSQFSVLGKKNLRRRLEISEPISDTDYQRQMRQLHKNCLAALDGDVKLFLVFLPLMPDLYIDYFLDELLECAGDVPVFGGMMSDELHSNRSVIFQNGDYFTNRVLLIGLSGDIRPAFGFGCDITVPSDYEPIVTKAHDNVIETVDGMPFTDYMSRLGLDETAVAEFPALLRVKPPGYVPTDHLKVDALTGADPVKGTGFLSSRAIPGSAISLGYLTTDNIMKSTRHCLDELFADMARQKIDSYQYDLLFCVSCLARYYTMFGQDAVEAKTLNSALSGFPAHFGFYAFSEVIPIRRQDGVLVNKKHGKALGLCAI